jgi:hypothetical protein
MNKYILKVMFHSVRDLKRMHFGITMFLVIVTVIDLRLFGYIVTSDLSTHYKT